MKARVALACLLLAAGACARARVVFPTGPAEPVPDALQLWWSATQACKGAQTFSAEIQANGNVGSEKLRRVTLHGAMTRNGEIALLAVAPVGPAVFNLAGRADRATLTLPRERRVLVAPAADIVEALIGLHLAPDDWLDVLSGCVTGKPPDTGVRINGVTILSLKAGAGRLRLDQDGAAWRIVAGERSDLLVEYPQFDGRWPRVAKLTTRPGAAVSVLLNMAIGQIFVNTTIPKAAFEAPVSTGFQPMTLDELRAIGPLGDGRSTEPAGHR